MTRLLQNRAVCATLFVLFTVAIIVNTLAGGSLLGMGTGPTLPPDTAIERADGPSIPPDPWEKDKLQRVDGPSIPPDPWEKDKYQITASNYSGKV